MVEVRKRKEEAGESYSCRIPKGYKEISLDYQSMRPKRQKQKKQTELESLLEFLGREQ